jgi:NADH-ubiquinone oxidoreductase chain 5
MTHPNAPKTYYLKTHEPTATIIIPLIILSLLSIFFGYIFSDLFVGMGTDFFNNSLFLHPNHITLIEAEFSLPTLTKLAPTIGTILTGIITIYLYLNTPLFLIEWKISNLGKKLYTFYNGKYLLDIIYNKYFISKSLHTGYIISKIVDRGTFELIGPYGLSLVSKYGANFFSNIDTGVITSYALYIVLSIITIVLILFAPLLITQINDITINNINILNEIKYIIIFIYSLLIITYYNII